MTIESLSYLKPSTEVVKNHPHNADRPLSPPPDLLKDNEEEEEEEEEENDADSLSTPSLISPSSPKQQPIYFNRIHSRKPVPHKSPSINDLFQIPMHDKSVVFQLDTTSDLTNGCKVISGLSLLSSLRRQVANARLQNNHYPILRKRVSSPSLVEIPLSSSRLALNKNRRRSTNSLGSTDRIVKHSGRPSRKKGPCQACQEASDGCMRKAFNWPFPTSQIYNDKGRPFVYLCNKCGLRYNKSGGAVCRHCRWVICKEEKRKAVHHINLMRHNRPGDAIVDPEEDIENFVCNPKYWRCGKPWKVGWVLTNTTEDDDDTLSSVTSN